MIQEIPINTASTTPNDYQCPDGDIAFSLNLFNENNSLRNSPSSSALFTLKSGYKMIYIHHQPSYTHYILWNSSESKLYYAAKSGSGISSTYTAFPTDYTDTEMPKDITSIGNTLMVNTSSGIQYFLCQTDAGAYKYLYLGNHIPELSIQFFIASPGSNRRDIGVQNLGIENHNNRFYIKYSTEAEWTYKRLITEIENNANDIIEELTNANRFMAPFFVRYAYRLYDGSFYMASSPVLLIPNSGVVPYAIWHDKFSEKDISSGVANPIWIYAQGFDLCYNCLDGDQISQLKKWSDIVESVVIFASPQFFKYVSGKKTDSGSCIASEAITDGFNYDNLTFNENPLEDWGIAHMEYFVIGVNNSDGSSGKFLVKDYDVKDLGYYFPMYSKSNEEFYNEIRTNSQFNKIFEIKTENLLRLAQKVEMKEGVLKNLSLQESLTYDNDYMSHDTLKPNLLYSYNNRLNIADIKRELYTGSSINIAVSRNDAILTKNKDISYKYTYDQTKKLPIETYVWVFEDARYVRLPSNSGTITENFVYGFYYFYPNPNGVYLEIKYNNSTKYYKMSVHPTLSGSYVFVPFNEKMTELTNFDKVSVGENEFHLSNRLYTSEANNPFIFPVTNMNSVGSGTIMEIVAATKALSEGQFGEFPLYAFTDEGIWALQTTANGGFSAVQPVARDICLCKESITQLDSAIAFASRRGVMVLQGSTVVCISDSINSINSPNIDKLGSTWSALFSGTEMASIASSGTNIDLKSYIKDCRIIFDYANQRLIVFKPHNSSDSTTNYAFVYSFKSQSWSYIMSKFVYTVNSYPDSYAINEKNEVVNLSEETVSTDSSTGLIVTRPLKLGSPNEFKYIDAVRLNGYFHTTDVTCLLYGSNDLMSWTLLQGATCSRLQGSESHPYKFFRLAIKSTLDSTESISSITISYHTKGTNDKLY